MEQLTGDVQVTDSAEETTQAVADEGGAQDAPESTTTDNSAELTKLRNEAAKWRTQLRETQAQLKEVVPLAEQYQQQQEAQKTETQKMAELIEALKAEKAQAEASAQAAQATATLTRLAAQAGADMEMVGMLDLSKLDLADEEATIATLQKFATPQSKSGAMSNPGRADADANLTSSERYSKLMSGNNIQAFGQ